MKDEIARSKGIVPLEALAEHEQGLAAYERLEVRDDSAEVEEEARAARNDPEPRYGLEHHQ